jgi:DNA ligase-associated metallophosphoesterase
MKSQSVTIEWAGEALTLLPERAIWWKRRETLFIADPHFGKAATFRFAGLPVPEMTHHADLNRLEGVLNRFSAKQLVILGDFFHARPGRSEATMSALAEWRRRHARLRILLVLGNHDRHAGMPPDEWDIHCVKGLQTLPPFGLSHEPVDIEGAFVLAGHWHPSFSLNDSIGSGVRLPCFYFSANMAVLPAFGTFTGTHPVMQRPGDRIFMVGPETIVKVPEKNSARGGTPARN